MLIFIFYRASEYFRSYLSESMEMSTRVRFFLFFIVKRSRTAKQRRIQFAWEIHALWFIVFVIQTRRSRALSSARGDLRTNVPFYFRHVPNQSWLLCCRGKCLFQVKQTDTSGPSLSLSSLHSAPVYFAERVMKGSKTWKKIGGGRGGKR